MALTRALVLRHATGKKESYEFGLLDVAQDHALRILELGGFFAGDDVIFKGGTSLRKCRLGNAGRFSTDIDLAVPDESVVMAVVAALDQQTIGGFTFTVRDADAKDGRKWFLDVAHAELGTVTTRSVLEFARRRPACAPERLVPVKLPVHAQYDFKIGALPVMSAVEACAEKLARYRRAPPLARDLYDLNWFASQMFDEKLLRRLWVLKVYGDVVEDGRGDKPLVADEMSRPRNLRAFDAGDIGALTQPIDIPAWEAKLRKRFAFLSAMDDDEKRFARCNARELTEVQTLLQSGGFRSS